MEDQSQHPIRILAFVGVLATFITILIALMASTFPGKYRLERAIMRRPGVFRAANWIRRKYHRTPLKHPDGHDEDITDGD